MAQAMMTGTRLEYVVVPIDGTVKRVKRVLEARTHKGQDGKNKTTYERRDKVMEEPGGFMVYFPRGHVLRISSQKKLKQYKLNRPAKLINLQGLNDPNSPVGKIMAAQDDDARRGAMASLEQQVIQMATAKTGKDLLTATEQPMEID